MAISKHKLNVELSKDVLNKCRKVVKKKECFNNVFNVANEYSTEFHQGNWKVAYGYYPVNIGNLYAKHCFIINEDNEVIDPTIILQGWREFDKGVEYITHTIFHDFNEYIDVLLKENGEPALYGYLYNTEVSEMMPWASKNGIILIG